VTLTSSEGFSATGRAERSLLARAIGCGARSAEGDETEGSSIPACCHVSVVIIHFNVYPKGFGLACETQTRVLDWHVKCELHRAIQVPNNHLEGGGDCLHWVTRGPCLHGDAAKSHASAFSFFFFFFLRQQNFAPLFPSLNFYMQMHFELDDARIMGLDLQRTEFKSYCDR
jgi:hypothetical protein